MKKAVIIVFCAAIFFPWFSSLEHSYQTSLWTYSDHRRGGVVSHDWQFRVGGHTESMEWTRVRLGLPIKPITIDIQSATGIVQVRIEVINFIRNLIPPTILVLILLGVRWLWLGPRAWRTKNPTSEIPSRG